MSLFGQQTTGSAGLFGGTTPNTAQSATGGGGGSVVSGGGLFGSTTPANTPTPSLGLFGSSTTPTSQPPPTGTSLFNTAANTGAGSSTSQTGGLFGSATNTPATAGGGLFGTGTTAATTAPATGGLFGSAPAATPAPETGGGLFSSTTPMTGQTGGGLFGSTTPAAAGAAGGGLFGSTTPSAIGATGATGATGGGGGGGGGLFAKNTTLSSQPATQGTGLSLFGGTTPPASTASKPSLFGAINTSTTQHTTASQTQPAVKIDWTNLAPYHKFQELSDPVRELVEFFDNHIRSEIQRAESLAATFPEHREMIKSVATDTELLQRKLYTTHIFLESDAKQLARLEELQKQDDQHASLSIRNLDILRLPHAARVLQASQYGISQQQQQSSQQTSPFPSSSASTSETDVTSNTGMINYFNKNAAEMEKQLHVIGEAIGEVEGSLKSVEEQAIAATRERRALEGAKKDIAEGRQGARQLISTLKEFNDALYDVSVRLVDVKEGVRQLKQTRTDGNRGQGANFRGSVRR